MFPLADEAAAQAPVQFGHLIVALATFATTIGTAILGGIKWFGKHVEALRADSVIREARDAKVIDENQKAFLSALAKQQEEHTKTIQTLTTDCARERGIDRENHTKTVSLMFRFAGLPAPGDSGKFNVRDLPPSSGQEKKTP